MEKATLCGCGTGYVSNLCLLMKQSEKFTDRINFSLLKKRINPARARTVCPLPAEIVGERPDPGRYQGALILDVSSVE